MNKEFRIDELFLVEGTKSLDAGKLKFIDEGINFIGRTDEDNGIQGKIETQSFEPNMKNTITATVIGNYKYVKFQEEPYYCSQNINKLTPLFNIDKLLALYFCTLISKFTSNWNGQQGGYKLEQLKTFKMFLPVIENSNPNHKYTVDDIDWQYMRDYIKELKRDRIKELDAYLQATGLNDYELTNDEKKILSNKAVNFRDMRIGDLFVKVEAKCKKTDFNKRKDTSSEPNDEFCVPLINAKLGDNGIMFYGRAEDWNTQSMCIDIVQNGAVATGKVYIQPQPTAVLWDAYLIKPIKEGVSEEVLLYFARCIEKITKERFSYEKKATWERIKECKITIPITSKGELDFDYMERYIRAIEKLVIADVVKYKDKVME